MFLEILINPAEIFLHMNKTLHKIELWVDRVIPYLVLTLLVLIILEFAFKEEAKPYELYIEIIDVLVLVFFCIDLVFKYMKVKKIPQFLRHHWLDIIAIFPFFLLFRFFEEVYTIINIPQFFRGTALHESIVLEKEGIRLIRETEKAGKISRSRFILRALKPLQRLPRLVKIIPYFERPTKRHHKLIHLIRKERLKSIKN